MPHESNVIPFRPRAAAPVPPPAPAPVRLDAKAVVEAIRRDGHLRVAGDALESKLVVAGLLSVGHVEVDALDALGRPERLDARRAMFSPDGRAWRVTLADPGAAAR